LAVSAKPEKRPLAARLARAADRNEFDNNGDDEARPVEGPIEVSIAPGRLA
jgi:hypothetical protein